MTVADLIKQLKTLPQDALIVVRGYEEGLNQADMVSEVKVVDYKHDEAVLPYYYGEFEKSENTGTPAVQIWSKRDLERN